MSGEKQPDWPPIISTAHRPPWIRWRDIAITISMWGLFLFFLAGETDTARQALDILTGKTVDKVDAGPEAFLDQMTLTAGIILFLMIALTVATLASRRRRNASLLRPQPLPVEDRDLARDLGLDEQALNDMRRQKIVALDVDEQGRVSLRPGWKPRTQAAAD